MKNKKKAFTLTELLIVVIVLGVLSAVAVPKMSRMLETRRTTEAEDMFAAVRAEQEMRCVFGKNYSVDVQSLPVMAEAGQSANYDYILENSGMRAQRKGRDYSLRMPSYRAGTICCSGEECKALNKTYPECDNNISTDECAACDLVPSTKACGAPWTGGTMLRPVNPDCTYGEWDSSGCQCNKENPKVEACGGNMTGNITYYLNPATCEYGEPQPDCGCDLQPETKACPAPLTGIMTRPVNPDCTYGEWDDSACQCNLPPTKTEDCSTKYTSPHYTGQILYTLDPNTCSYGEPIDQCTCSLQEEYRNCAEQFPGAGVTGTTHCTVTSSCQLSCPISDCAGDCYNKGYRCYSEAIQAQCCAGKQKDPILGPVCFGYKEVKDGSCGATSSWSKVCGPDTYGAPVKCDYGQKYRCDATQTWTAIGCS